MPARTILAPLALLAAQPALAQPAPAPVPAPGASAQTAPARPAFTQPSLNVFRRFAAELRPRMIDFYGKAIGLAALQPIQLTAAQQIVLFRVGATGQIKLAAGLGDREYRPGAPGAATGVRFFTITLPDEAAAKARFTSAGFAAPVFRDLGGRRVATVTDPGGFPVRLAIDPTATPRGVELGINVSDPARSRAFYRDFAGLEELPPETDPLLKTVTYPFRHGETTIRLFSIGHDLPRDTGSVGIQYVIGNVDAVNAAAQAQHVTVETPLGGVPGFNVRTVWLNDPDGVTDYFYQLGARPAAPAQS